jgi:hypothetical protein
LIGIDTSAFQRYVNGLHDSSTLAVDAALREKVAHFPPIVVTEILSHPRLPLDVAERVKAITLLPVRDGMWERAGLMRADLLRRGLKAHLADCLIAQSCIDNDAPLITYDRDFRHFESAGLRVI